jgi:SAM-dependent methyltransferase
MSDSNQQSVERGSSVVQGALWSARAKDWAEAQEPAQSALYGPVFDAIDLRPGANLLDVGCGSGVAAAIAARRGAKVSGIDASEPAIAAARARVPEADFRVGEIEALPFEDATFDAVTGFNAFQYAARPVRALAEARRVARRNAAIVLVTWGPRERCEAAAYLAALGRFLPPPPPGAPGPFALSEPGVLESLAREAGLVPDQVRDVDGPFVYADESTALRGLLSAGPAVRAIQTAQDEAPVRAAVLEAIAPYRRHDSGYRLENTFRYVIARVR